MKAMILAAGRGERMRPLTDTIPKALLPVAGKPLIVYAIENLRRAGFSELVINLAYLGEQIRQTLGSGEQWGVTIRYSLEGTEGLETAGGIRQALPLLGEEPFLVVNADVACDFPLQTLKKPLQGLAHLVLIENPAHHPDGDFSLQANGRLQVDGENRLTFSGIGVYHPRLFAELPEGKQRLAPLLREKMAQGLILGEKFTGFWMDIGTSQRLDELAAHYTNQTL
jgi:MurNAc alpha-1-phosphate uridylyltransferase